MQTATRRDALSDRLLYTVRPVAGGGAGGAQAPPEIFRLELIFAIKVEFWY